MKYTVLYNQYLYNIALIEMDMNFPLYIGDSLMHSDILGKISLYSIYDTSANHVYTLEGKIHNYFYLYTLVH